MTIKAECTACGRDCSNCCATYYGDVYCIACLPAKRAIVCKLCGGRGMVADYVGLEMKPVGVECEDCHGTGKQ